MKRKNMHENDAIRIDGTEKVIGHARYGDDLQVHGMLHAASRHSGIPAGRITSINTDHASAMPGVKAIALYHDIPGQPCVGPIRQDQYVLCDKEVFYEGDVMAVVAAETRAQAQAAADAIDINIDPLPPVSSIDEALKPDCRLVHADLDSNVLVHYPLRKGSIEDGFISSDQVIERTYQTGFHEHAYIEPESVLAEPDSCGPTYTIRGSIQNPYTTRRVVAGFMNVPLNRIIIKPSVLGGSFGGKDDQVNVLACRAALLARMTRRPVKLTLTREDSIRESYKRHPYRMKYKVGFTREGRLLAMKIEILADGGAYSSMSHFVTWRSVVQATGPYVIPNVETDITTVYTNNTYTGAFRGFGTPQIVFAQETLMDEIAACCNISPLEMRLRNGLKQDSITASGQRLNGHTVSLHEVLKKAAKSAKMDEKKAAFDERNKNDSRYRYGIGLACSFRGCSLGAEGLDTSCALMRILTDGSVTVGTAVHENGQGLSTTMCIIACEALGITMDRISFLPSQTDTMPDGGPTVASRGTLVGGNAVIDAAEQLKIILFQYIRDDLRVDDLAQTIWYDNTISAPSTHQHISFTDAVKRAVDAGENLSACGWFNAPAVSWEEETGQGNAYFTYVYGCQIAEVKVDTHTGKTEILHVTAAHDVGRAMNRMGLEGQIYGGVAQGIGYAILEDYNISNATLKSVNLDEYLLPTIRDVPQITPLIIENPDCNGPYGAKSIGEPTLELTAAAINNAFNHATGKTNRQLPLTLEQAFLGKNLRKPSRASETIFECKRGNDSSKNTPRMTRVDVFTPKSLLEALSHLSTNPCTVLAGGTDVLIQLRKETSPRHLLNIYHLPEIHGIDILDNSIHIRAMTPLCKILDHPAIQTELPLLCKAVSQIGSTQIRNRATLAGNIVNAAPCADSVPPLLIYDASIKLKSMDNERVIPLDEFIKQNYQTIITDNELLTEIIIPRYPSNGTTSTALHKLGRRNALNITRISAALLLQLDDRNLIKDFRLACGSLFNRPLRLTDIEKRLAGQPLNDETIASIEAPLADMIEHAIGGRWSSEYKKPVFIHMVHDLLTQIQNDLSRTAL